MPDNDIATDWQSFSPERRDALLGKMTPEQKKKLRTTLEANGGSNKGTPSVVPPGAIRRYAEGTGLPTSTSELKAVGKMALNPPELIGNVIRNYGLNLYAQGDKALKDLREARESVLKGEPLFANVGKAAAAETEFLLRGVLMPVGGGSIQAWGEDLASKNYRGATGDALAVLTNALFLKSARPSTSLTKADVVAKVADLSKGFEDVKTVIGDLSKASPSTPNTVGDLIKTVNGAKDEMNRQSGLALFPIRNQVVDPAAIRAIADRIRSRITPDMLKTPGDLKTAKMLEKRAIEFDQSWTYGEADQYRMNHNPEVQGVYKMPPADRAQYLRAHPELAAEKEIVDGIKDAVYPAMDRAAGKPDGYFAGLKHRQSTLISLQKALDAQVDELATAQAQIRATSRFSRENLSMYQSHLGPPGVSLHRVQNIFVKEKPLTSANRAVRGAFSGRPTSKAVIYSLPVRELLLSPQPELPKNATAKDALRHVQGKPPGQQKRDLEDMQRSSNPLMP